MSTVTGSTIFLLLAGFHVEYGTPPIVFRNVHVVDVEHGAILRERAILVANGRIARIEASAELVVPAGAEVVEGAGRYVLPGLFDMHVHLNEADDPALLVLYLANGVTSVQSMHGGPYQLALRERVARGELRGPRIFTTGPTTAALRVHTVEQAERVAREQQAAGYDAIKMYGDGQDRMPRATYDRLIEVAHEVGIQVVGHAPRNLPFSAVLEERQDSIDHMEEIVYTDERLGALVAPYVRLQFGGDFEGNSELLERVPDFAAELRDSIEALAKDVKASGLHVTPTLVTFGTIQQTIDEDFFGLFEHPELRYVHPTRRHAWAPERARFRNGGWKPHLAFMAEYLERNHELQMALTRAFHAAGVSLMTGTDAPFDFVVQGFSLHDELALFVRCGLTPIDALRAATIVPARFRGVAHESGSVAVGKRADLVLVEADPLADIAATRRIAGVCAAGRWLSRETLDAHLQSIAARHAEIEPAVNTIAAALERDDHAAAIEAYSELGTQDVALSDFLESRLNARGYELLQEDHVVAAIPLFLANTELFPASTNAWDSLGEAYAQQGETDLAIEAYEHVLELDPEDENARACIEELVRR